MNRNTVLAVVLSAGFLFFWWAFVKPPAPNTVVPAPAATISGVGSATCPAIAQAPTAQAQNNVEEKEVVVENDQYKAVFTNRGAAVKHWFLKDHGTQTDLVMCGEQLSTYPGTMFSWRLLGDM